MARGQGSWKAWAQLLGDLAPPESAVISLLAQPWSALSHCPPQDSSNGAAGGWQLEECFKWRPLWKATNEARWARHELRR